MMKKMLALLKGKKTSIAMILGATLVYLQGHGIIDNTDAQVISIILVALGIGVNVTDYKINKG